MKFKIIAAALTTILILSFLAFSIFSPEREDPDYPLKKKSYKGRSDGVEISLGEPYLFADEEKLKKAVLAIYADELLKRYNTNTICIGKCITLEERYFKFFMGLIFDVKSFKEGVEFEEISDKVWPQFRDVTREADAELKKFRYDGNLSDEEDEERRKIRQEINEKVLDRIIDAYKKNKISYQIFDKFSLVFIQSAISKRYYYSSRRHYLIKKYFDSLREEDQAFLLSVDDFQKMTQDGINEQINLLGIGHNYIVSVTNLKNKRLLKISFNVVGYKNGRSTAYDIYPFPLSVGKLRTFSDDTVIAPKEIGSGFLIQGRLYDSYEIKNIRAVWDD